MTKQNAKTQMLEHSKAKVELYKRYLSIYLNIISRDGYTKKIYLYDLFCGEGEYSDGSKGSPLVALEVIREHFFQNDKKIISIRLFLNDDRREKIDKVERLVDDCFKPYNCVVEFRNEDYSELVKHMINEIEQFENEKGLIFIDPYGYKQIKLNDIKRSLDGNKTEVILFLPISFMYRFAEVAQADDLPGYEPLRKFIGEVFSPTIQHFKSVYDFIKKLKFAFRDKLKNYYIDTFTIERDSHNIYCLFFFTSHIRGFEKMIETKWKTDEQEGRGFRLSKQGKLFSLRELTDFPQKVYDFIRLNKNCTNKDLYKYGLFNGYLPKHLRQIISQFQEKGKLRVISQTQQKIRKGAFYLDYKYHTPYGRIIVKFEIVNN